MRLGDMNLPGYGDPETWGPISHPMDPRQPCAIGEEEAREAAIEELLQERMCSPAWVSDAQGDMTGEEYDLITAAIIGGDIQKVGELVVESVQRVIRAYAERDIDKRMARDRREAAEERQLARAGF